MNRNDPAAPYWVHQSFSPHRAKLHLRDCVFCNGGTGMLRRPTVPGGRLLWSSYSTLEAATAFIALLGLDNFSMCKACLPSTPKASPDLLMAVD